MTPLDIGVVAALGLGFGGVAVHHQLRKAREARIRTEAEAFGGGSDDRE